MVSIHLITKNTPKHTHPKNHPKNHPKDHPKNHAKNHPKKKHIKNHIYIHSLFQLFASQSMRYFLLMFRFFSWYFSSFFLLVFSTTDLSKLKPVDIQRLRNQLNIPEIDRKITENSPLSDTKHFQEALTRVLASSPDMKNNKSNVMNNVSHSHTKSVNNAQDAITSLLREIGVVDHATHIHTHTHTRTHTHTHTHTHPLNRFFVILFSLLFE